MKKFTEEELKKKLTRESYHVTQETGTETPFTGEYVSMKDKGMYNCIVCGAELFPSDTKFESGTGWPSFYDVANKGNVILENDSSLEMNRVEVMCANCGAHLGHVFNDGPADKTGLRYCINSCALDFNKEK